MFSDITVLLMQWMYLVELLSRGLHGGRLKDRGSLQTFFPAAPGSNPTKQPTLITVKSGCST